MSKDDRHPLEKLLDALKGSVDDRTAEEVARDKASQAGLEAFLNSRFCGCDAPDCKATEAEALMHAVEAAVKGTVEKSFHAGFKAGHATGVKAGIASVLGGQHVSPDAN